MSETLTRENRYEECGFLAGLPEPGASRVSPVKVARCKSCGSLVVSGGEDLHERLHPRISCDRAHPARGVYCHGGHPWEDQFAD